jgi:hypothetical protein
VSAKYVATLIIAASVKSNIPRRGLFLEYRHEKPHSSMKTPAKTDWSVFMAGLNKIQSGQRPYITMSYPK